MVEMPLYPGISDEYLNKSFMCVGVGRLFSQLMASPPSDTLLAVGLYSTTTPHTILSTSNEMGTVLDTQLRASCTRAYE